MVNTRIYVTRSLPEIIRRQLEVAGKVIIRPDRRPASHVELLASVRHADALLCLGDDLLDQAIIAAGKHLRIISTASAGVDHIDLQAAAEHGVIVTHSPGAAEHAVADMAMALLFACARHLVDADLFVKNRRWHYWSPDLFLGDELRGSTISIIGLGHIGLQVAHRAAGFSLRILYYDIERDPEAEELLRIQYGNLDDVLREADFVTLHMPLTPSTRQIIGERELRLMKPTAYLINTSRGGVIDQPALVRALREGWIAGAGLDVYEEEPPRADDPLLNLPNVVLSPHISANTSRSILSIYHMAAEQIVQGLQGQRPAHAVVWPAPRKQAA